MLAISECIVAVNVTTAIGKIAVVIVSLQIVVVDIVDTVKSVRGVQCYCGNAVLTQEFSVVCLDM